MRPGGITPTDPLHERSTRRLAHEYRSRSLYRVCGAALIGAAALFALSLLAVGGGVPATVAALHGAATPMRVGISWLATLAPALAAGGLLAISRHYRGTSREGWVLLAFAANVMGGVLLTLAFGLAAAGAPAALEAARVADSTLADVAVVQPLAILAASASSVGWMLFWLSLLLLSLALLRDRVWPRATAWGGPIVAVVEIVGLAMASTQGAAVLLHLLGCGYLALLGLSALRLVSLMRAAAAEVARVDD